jgi:hypothetical protein
MGPSAAPMPRAPSARCSGHRGRPLDYLQAVPTLPAAADGRRHRGGQFTRTRFICERCGSRGLVTGDDPAREPLSRLRDGPWCGRGRAASDREAATVSAGLVPRRRSRLETARRRLTSIFAEIDHRQFALVAWMESAWHALHDDRPIEGTITRWRYWDSDTGARKALGM